jgi:hypothetical protein
LLWPTSRKNGGRPRVAAVVRRRRRLAAEDDEEGNVAEVQEVDAAVLGEGAEAALVREGAVDAAPPSRDRDCEGMGIGERLRLCDSCLGV